MLLLKILVFQGLSILFSCKYYICGVMWKCFIELEFLLGICMFVIIWMGSWWILVEYG